MKTLLLLTSLLVFTAITAFAQKPRYQGEVNFGYGGEVMDFDQKITVETVHGALIGRKVTVGAGAGLHYHPDSKAAIIPVYATVRTVFRPERTSAFFNFDAGYGFIHAGNTDWNKGGVYLSPQGGVSIPLPRGLSLRCGVAYQFMTYSFASADHGENGSLFLNYFSLRVGFVF